MVFGIGRKPDYKDAEEAKAKIAPQYHAQIEAATKGGNGNGAGSRGRPRVGEVSISVAPTPKAKPSAGKIGRVPPKPVQYEYQTYAEQAMRKAKNLFSCPAGSECARARERKYLKQYGGSNLTEAAQNAQTRAQNLKDLNAAEQEMRRQSPGGRVGAYVGSTAAATAETIKAGVRNYAPRPYIGDGRRRPGRPRTKQYYTGPKNPVGRPRGSGPRQRAAAYGYAQHPDYGYAPAPRDAIQSSDDWYNSVIGGRPSQRQAAQQQVRPGKKPRVIRDALDQLDADMDALW